MDNLRHWFSTRPDWQVILLLIAATVALRLIAFHLYPYPTPRTADSQANMLGAETFAAGRLTNPAGPWNMFILDTPTRMMKYQPAMAGFMALGIVVFGHPHWGVVLLISLMVAGSYWALRGWVTQRAALAGAIIIMLIFRAPHYWIWNYWGGGHILLASFLMIGAYPRVILQHRYHAIIPGLLGLVLALLSRPFEGIILAASLSACGIFTLIRNFSAEQKKGLLRAIWLPTIVILGSYASFQSYYNYRITGEPLKLPYMLYHEKFEVAPFLLTESPNYANDLHEIGRLHRWQMTYYLNARDHKIEGTASASLRILGLINLHQPDTYNQNFRFIVIIIHLPLLYIIYKLWTRAATWPRLLPLLVSAITSYSGFLLIAWSLPHYMAPYFATLFVSFFIVLHELKLPPATHYLLAIMCILLLVFAGGNCSWNYDIASDYCV